MRTKMALASLVVLFAGIGLCLAADAQLGTWKLNESRSKLNPEAGKNLTVVYAPASDGIKVTVDGVDKDGKPTHNEWTGKFNGTDYPVTGDPTSDMRSYKRIDAHTLMLTIKKGGKVTSSGRVVVSHDGKSRTVSLTGTDSSGKKVRSTAVYDKG